MIYLSHNIFKLFGELAIVWTEKIDYSLYISLLMQMMISTLISVGLFLVLIAISGYYEQYENEKLFASQAEQVTILVEQIRNEVKNDHLTFKEADKKDFDDDSPYHVEFYRIDDDELSKYNYYKNRNYIFNIAFADTDGVIVFESEEAEFASETSHIIAGIISLILFFVLSIRTISKLVSYIKVIESGVKKLSTDDKLYKIPVVGKNELARLANSVNKIKEELDQKTKKEKADEQYQRMLITNMSHDLRTPLTSIIGYLDLAKKEIFLKDSMSKACSYLEVVEKSSLRLNNLVADLFLYSKILSNDIKINKQSIDLNVLLLQIIELKPQKIKFNSSIKDATASLDIEVFHRIIDNLLDNAIKYGTKDEEIILSSYKSNENFIIEITNKTNDDLSRKINLLTKRLYTADENRKQGSSGLGLSIVSELCNKINAKFKLTYNSGIVKAHIKIQR